MGTFAGNTSLQSNLGAETGPVLCRAASDMRGVKPERSGIKTGYSSIDEMAQDDQDFLFPMIIEREYWAGRRRWSCVCQAIDSVIAIWRKFLGRPAKDLLTSSIHPTTNNAAAVGEIAQLDPSPARSCRASFLSSPRALVLVVTS